MALFDITTPEQYNCYIERKNAEFKARQRRVYDQNLLRMELEHIDEMNNILDKHEERMKRKTEKPLSEWEMYVREKKKLIERLEKLGY